MARADLHVHTEYSHDCFAAIGDVIDFAEHHTELDTIAITDHNTIRGAQLAAEYARRKNYTIKVVIGEEILTKNGEVIGLFLKKWIAPKMTLVDTIKAIHAQGGLAIIPHPWRYPYVNRDYCRFGVSYKRIRRTVAEEHIDGIETNNASIIGRLSHTHTLNQNAKHLRLPEVGGSDAHLANHIGAMWTQYEDDLYAALQSGAVKAGGSFIPVKEQLTFKFIALFAFNFFRSKAARPITERVRPE